MAALSITSMSELESNISSAASTDTSRAAGARVQEEKWGSFYPEAERAQTEFLPKTHRLQVFQPFLCFVSSTCSQTSILALKNMNWLPFEIWRVVYILYILYGVTLFNVTKLGIYLNLSESHISCSTGKRLVKESYRTDLFKLLWNVL